eukprot:760518-Hanusia_phi.AAC.4
MADIVQMAGAVAVEMCGGPKVSLRYGRMQAEASNAVQDSQGEGGAAHRKMSELGAKFEPPDGISME